MHKLPTAVRLSTAGDRAWAHLRRPGPVLAASMIALLCLTQLAFAGTVPPPDQDAAGWLQALYVAVTSKQWGIVAGVALVGLVYPLRLWGPNFVKGKVGGLILAFVVSLAGTLGIALAAGVAVSIPLVVSAVTTAATAAGLWGWIKAHVPGGAKAAAASVAKNPAPVVVVSILIATLACGASQRTTTLQTAELAVNAASAGLIVYDKQHQEDLANKGTPDEAAAALKAYRVKRATLNRALAAAVDAIIVAIKLNDQPSLDGLAAAITEVIRDYQALKGTAP